MAYALRYYHDYCNTLTGVNCRVSIEQWNYVGVPVEIECGPIPFDISKDTSNLLKKGKIDPTQATVAIQSSPNIDFESFWTAFESEYRITHYIDSDIDWTGFAIPNGFRYDMDAYVQTLVVSCSDGLARLQGMLFAEDNGTNYGATGSTIEGDFVQSFMWVAKECLKKTGLLLPIWTMVDIKPALDSSTAAVQIGINTSINLITIMDPSRDVKNDIQNGYRLLVRSGAGEGLVVTVSSFNVVAGLSQDTIHITPVETMTGGNVTGNAIIELVPIVADPSATYPDPLTITVHDVRTYVRDQDIEGKTYYEVSGSALSAWDVLDNLAKQWNAIIHQNNGHWEIKRINADKVDSGNYQWFVYNSEGVEIGRSPFGMDIDLPCVPTRAKWQPLGHPVQMDRVLGFVGVNYVYKFKTEGDSLINLIKNGNMNPPATLLPPPNMDPASYTPEYWRRYNPGTTNYMTLQYHALPAIPGAYPPAGIPYVTVGNVGERFYYNRYLSAGSSYSMSVGQGDRLKISFWYRGRYRISASGNIVATIDPLVLRIFIAPPNEGHLRVQLVNKGATGIGNLAGATPEQLSSPVKVPSMWVPYSQHNDDYLAFEVGREYTIGGLAGDNQPAIWFKYEIEADPSPVAGNLVLEITGTGEPQLGSGYYTYSLYDSFGGYRYRQGKYSDRGGDVAGFFAAKIVESSSEAVSQIHPYWYRNDAAYTDSIDDIEVITGDDDNPDHVSNIYVMDGSTRRAIKSWDTWLSDFGWGALGLIVAKSIMEQYYRPWRLVYGDFVSDGIDWSKRIQFEERPGERYIIIGGTIDRKRSRFSGILAQVYDSATPELPPGGNDGGGTVDPNWQATGTVRCIKDENGLNTGDQEQQEVDMNPASLTYGQVRWVNIGQNTGQCPIGEPVDLFWGASTLPIDPNTLEYFGYDTDLNDYTVRFNNDGTGKYLVFLHRASLGTVTSIRYENGGWQAYGNTPSWQYEADTTINGYTYKVMRQIYMSGVFNQLPLIFTIE